MTELLSVYAKDDTLYIAEKVDKDIKIKTIKYDDGINPSHNMPSSMNSRLPTDQVLLDQYALSSFHGMYDFEYQPNVQNGYITYMRCTDICKDVFMCFDCIVHVQDYEESTVQDKAINEILDGIKYCDHDPISFLNMANEKLGKLGIDLEKEIESFAFEQPNEPIESKEEKIDSQ